MTEETYYRLRQMSDSLMRTIMNDTYKEVMGSDEEDEELDYSFEKTIKENGAEHLQQWELERDLAEFED